MLKTTLIARGVCFIVGRGNPWFEIVIIDSLECNVGVVEDVGEAVLEILCSVLVTKL